MSGAPFRFRSTFERDLWQHYLQHAPRRRFDHEPYAGTLKQAIVKAAEADIAYADAVITALRERTSEDDGYLHDEERREDPADQQLDLGEA